MPHLPMRAAVQYLRRLANGRNPAEGEDGDLLDRFVRQGDEVAFAELLQRHGPMVLGVCRRLLGDADAEDAFQATFVVLARRAGTVRNRSSLASWLYGVAVRLSHRTRADAARRRERERHAAVPTAEDAAEAERRDLRSVLDEELGRLPNRYRAPLVLCYLEGRTHAEAAQQLGWKDGTVCSRLARARALLRGRLTRRGLAPVVAAGSMVLADQGFLAAVPPTLGASAMRLAAPGGAPAGADVRADVLARGMEKAMQFNKVKTVAAMLLTVGLLAGATGLVARSAAKGQPAAAPQEKLAPAVGRAEPKDPPKEEKKKPLLTDGKGLKVLPTDPALTRLQKELYGAALLQAQLRLEKFRVTTGEEAAVLESVQMLYEAELALAEKQADRLAVMEKRLNSLIEIETISEERYKAGALPAVRLQDVAHSRAKRLEAEIQLLKAKQKK